MANTNHNTTAPAESRDAVLSTTVFQPPTAEERIRINASRAAAYSELEGQITLCLLHARVADIVAHATLSDAEPSVTPDQATAVTHSIYQLVDAVEDLHKQYYATSDERS